MIEKRSSIVVLAPFVVLLFAVLFAGVNLPHWDEWDTWMAILPRLNQEGLSWSYLWKPHNGHYFPITRFVLFCFSRLHLGPKSLMAFESSLWGANLILFWIIARDSFLRLPNYYLFALSALLLSFCQREVFFFSMNMHFSLSVLSLLWFTRNMQKDNALGLILSILLAFVSFSTWVCLIPLLLLPLLQKSKAGASQKIFYLSLITISFIAGYFYFVGVVGTIAPHAANLLTQLIRAPFMFLRILGSPFVVTGRYQNFLFHGIAIALGALYLLLLTLALQKVGRTRLPKSPLIVSLYGVLAAILISVARGEYGIDNIGASRYTVLVVSGWSCLILTLLSESVQTKWLHRTLNSLLILGLLCSTMNFLGETAIRRPRMLRAQGVIRAVAAGTEISGADVYSLAAIYPDPKRPIEMIQNFRVNYDASEFVFMFN